MSMRALRTLISVHRYGSFRAAAEAEHLTPAAVSQQMRNLEATWTLEIFERSQRSPKLTEVGLSLVNEASLVVAAFDALADKVRAQDDISGELILGAVPTTLTGLMPLALSHLKVQHPGLQIRIVPGLSNRLLLELERGQIHAAVISRPEVLFSRARVFENRDRGVGSAGGCIDPTAIPSRPVAIATGHPFQPGRRCGQADRGLAAKP